MGIGPDRDSKRACRPSQYLLVFVALGVRSEIALRILIVMLP